MKKLNNRQIMSRATTAYWRAWSKTHDFFMKSRMKTVTGKNRVVPTSQEARAVITANEAAEAGLEAAIKSAIRLARK